MVALIFQNILANGNEIKQDVSLLFVLHVYEKKERRYISNIQGGPKKSLWCDIHRGKMFEKF